MYSHLTVIVVKIACCFCYVAYEMFQGFDVTQPISYNTVTDGSTSTKTTKNTVFSETTIKMDLETATTFKTSKFLCPEEERPANIGPYEVPTRRDFVLLARQTLTRMFKNYHQKALYFLKDIQEATRATVEVEKKCQGNNKVTYRKCVKDVSNRCELITKSLVTSLEKQREDVTAFTEESVCKMTAMKADPVQLIKILAMEDASLDFAVPGFLRLLGACSFYCDKYATTKNILKPVRHMTDQDLVIRHFLTKKNYIQLIKNSN